MEKLLERIYYGLQFSPSTTYSFGSTWNSKKTQKKIEKHLAHTSLVFTQIFWR